MNKGKGKHLKKYSIHLLSKKRKIKKFMKEYAWICHIYIHGAVNMKFEMLSTCL